MRKIGYFITLLLITSNVRAINHNIFGEAPKGAKLTISNGFLNVNGTSFKESWKINPFLSAVGGKFVTQKLFHKVHTFNELGIHVYEYRNQQEANEVQISFVKQKPKYAPKTSFNGSFKIEKLPITRKTNILKVIKSLPDYHFTKGSSGNFYRGEYKGVYVYLNYADESFRTLDFVSFGVTGKNIKIGQD